MKVTFKKDEYVLLDDTNKIIANYIVTKGAKGDKGDGENNIIEDVKVNNNSLPVTSKSVNIDLTGYVEKETGKGLSTNDYTTTEKNKLAGIEASADVNIIENIKVNGVAQTVTDKAVDISVPINTSDLNNDSDFVVGSDLSPVATSGSYNDLSNKPTIEDITSKITLASNWSIDSGKIYKQGKHIFGTIQVKTPSSLPASTNSQNVIQLPYTLASVYIMGGFTAAGDKWSMTNGFAYIYIGTNGSFTLTNSSAATFFRVQIDVMEA